MLCILRQVLATFSCCDDKNHLRSHLSPSSSVDRASVCGTEGRRFESSLGRQIISNFGGVAEWLKASVSKTGVPIYQDREFESHPLRQVPVAQWLERKPPELEVEGSNPFWDARTYA